MQTASCPDLYWISGSPPSWRVMLALTLKGIPYRSCRLDAARQENRTPAYLRLNPTGQVPTLVHRAVTVRESIAILAYLDRARPRNHRRSGALPVDAMVRRPTGAGGLAGALWPGAGGRRNETAALARDSTKSI